MTPSMQLSDIIRSYADHPDKERITRDLNRAMTLGHQFGIDRAAEAAQSATRATLAARAFHNEVQELIRALKVTEVRPVTTSSSDFT